MRPNTRMVYLESPGSQTMEMQDVPAIAAAAKANGAIVAIDNTWSAGHFFKPLAKGCDISIQAATKYIVGHSDAMLGVVTTTEELWETYRQTYEGIGLFAGPDDNYLALRGLHTLAVRLDRHMANALIVAEWLRERPEVEAVLCSQVPRLITVATELSNRPMLPCWVRPTPNSSVWPVGRSIFKPPTI